MVLYVALMPDLNVSSFRESAEEAQNAIRKAAEAFIEECDRISTLGSSRFF
jgi:translation initiation factor 2B subunit (eIF-2B alpha/beta/delta family)